MKQWVIKCWDENDSEPFVGRDNSWTDKIKNASHFSSYKDAVDYLKKNVLPARPVPVRRSNLTVEIHKCLSSFLNMTRAAYQTSALGKGARVGLDADALEGARAAAWLLAETMLLKDQRKWEKGV